MNIGLICRDQVVDQVIGDFLSSIGHQVVPLDPAGCWLRELKKHPLSFDLIIADIDTANTSDLDKAKEVHKRHTGIPIIAIMDSYRFLPKDLAVSHGVYMYLHKPISLMELELIVHRLDEYKANGLKQS